MTQAPDLIEPPTASQPAQVLLLACAALTAGDLEAAVALYEPDAVLSWGPDRAAVGRAAIRGVLAEAMNMRLPLRGRADSVLITGNLALITGARSVRGTGPDGVAIALAGPATLIARRQPDGTWLTVADEWNPLAGTVTAPPRPTPYRLT